MTKQQVVMPLKHGSKIYCQVLLDKNRYQLAKALADRRGVRVTAMMREVVYKFLEAELPQEYGFALMADNEAWQESVQRRVQGRINAREQKKVQPEDS